MLKINFRSPVLWLVLLILASCSSSRINHLSHSTASEVSCIFLQINDFYEISPVDEGRSGGAARIGSLRKKLMSENSNTYTVLAGDFLSPSLIGTLKVDGERVKGKQMVEALNSLGLNLACFGNHEFDIDEGALKKRIQESRFDWIGSNILNKTPNGLQPFTKDSMGTPIPIPKHRILEFKNPNGQKFVIGVISPCINSNKASYVEYQDPLTSTKEEIEKIKNRVDLIVLLSHLNKHEDMALAEKCPEIKLIMGGHEHDHMQHFPGNAMLTKADANARSAWVHRLKFNTKTRETQIKSELVFLNQEIPLDGEVSLVVNRWKSQESKIMREMGFDPDEVLQTLGSPMDAREQTIRNQPAAFCQLICRSMSAAFPQSDCSIMNSGSVRVDDEFKGKLSQYDIIRSLPYGGPVVSVKMKGSLLIQILETGLKNKGRGGYLQYDRIERGSNLKWNIGNSEILPENWYRVGMTDYLIKGLEQGLEFLTPFNKDIESVIEPKADDNSDIRRDIRLVVIDYLKKSGR